MEVKDSQTPQSYRGIVRDKPLLVLHINDNTDDQVLFQAAAKEATVPVEWQVAETAKGGMSYLRSLVEMSRQ